MKSKAFRNRLLALLRSLGIAAVGRIQRAKSGPAAGELTYIAAVKLQSSKLFSSMIGPLLLHPAKRARALAIVADLDQLTEIDPEA